MSSGRVDTSSLIQRNRGISSTDVSASSQAEPLAPHESPDWAARHFDTFPVQLSPELVAPIDAQIDSPDDFNLGLIDAKGCAESPDACPTRWIDLAFACHRGMSSAIY